MWIDGEGWREATILEVGMKLLDKHSNATVTIISQIVLEQKDTVYNFQVHDFSTYYNGEQGVWDQNAACCQHVTSKKEAIEKLQSIRNQLLDNTYTPLNKRLQ